MPGESRAEVEGLDGRQPGTRAACAARSTPSGGMSEPAFLAGRAAAAAAEAVGTRVYPATPSPASPRASRAVSSHIRWMSSRPGSRSAPLVPSARPLRPRFCTGAFACSRRGMDSRCTTG